MFLVLSFALLLDYFFAEPKKFHPLVGFGNLANKVEKSLNQGEHRKIKGFIAVAILLLPFLLLAHALQVITNSSDFMSVVAHAVVLYLAVGWQSLLQHANAIYVALAKSDLPLARKKLSMIVSRDCEQLTEKEVVQASIESVLENGADAIFNAVFWYLVAGITGVVCYRLANTLDAMWGYRIERFNHFGFAAAKFDDVLNFIPARLTALSYALVGSTKQALACWNAQGKNWKSPNAGPVMAAGAGALEVSLGGAATYDGGQQQRPELGVDNRPLCPDSIHHACSLVNRSLALWLLTVLVLLLLGCWL